jgi:hypothetical protein
MILTHFEKCVVEKEHPLKIESARGFSLLRYAGMRVRYIVLPALKAGLPATIASSFLL